MVPVGGHATDSWRTARPVPDARRAARWWAPNTDCRGAESTIRRARFTHPERRGSHEPSWAATLAGSDESGPGQIDPRVGRRPSRVISNTAIRGRSHPFELFVGRVARSEPHSEIMPDQTTPRLHQSFLCGSDAACEPVKGHVGRIGSRRLTDHRLFPVMARGAMAVEGTKITLVAGWYQTAPLDIARTTTAIDFAESVLLFLS
jgi:hypothetical protein